MQEPARRVADLVEHAGRATRSLAAKLAPAVLYELGLVPALERLGEEISHNFAMQVSVSDDGRDKPLSPESGSILYRCARELLVNAAKHAKATRADVEIKERDGLIVVSVSDAGVGFEVFAQHQGTGLRSVRERLSYVGGSLEIGSTPGEGTVAVLTAPLAGEAEPDRGGRCATPADAPLPAAAM